MGVQFSLGFMKSTAVWPFGNASSFGAPGSGGSLGFADPITGVGYAYITSRMGTSLIGDPRDVALRDALYSAILKSSAPTEDGSSPNEVLGAGVSLDWSLPGAACGGHALDPARLKASGS